MTILTKTLELKLIYDYNINPTHARDHAYNLAYKLGNSSRRCNRFDSSLERLAADGVVKKIYDFLDGDFREGYYIFTDNEKIGLSFFGSDHMNYKLFLEYE